MRWPHSRTIVPVLDVGEEVWDEVCSQGLIFRSNVSAMSASDLAGEGGDPHLLDAPRLQAHSSSGSQ